MDKSTLIPVAVTNLKSSQGFLGKLLDVCHRVVGASKATGSVRDSEKQIVQAITLLTRMTEAVLTQAEYCQQFGGTFSAHQVLATVLGVSPQSNDDSADIQRMRIIMDMCLQQGDQHRRRAFFNAEELNRLRTSLAAVHDELQAARSVLD